MLHISKKALLLASKRVLRPQDAFANNARSGTGSSVAVTLPFGPDLVWSKRRTTAQSHFLYDTLRGANTALSSDSTAAGASQTQSLNSFDTSGYTLGSSSNVNSLNVTYIDWCFKRAANFMLRGALSKSTGTAVTADLSSLGVVGLVIAKVANTTGPWMVWHRGFPSGQNAVLNSTAAPSTTDANLSVSGTTLTLGAAAPAGNYIVYAFAHQPSGIIQCGAVSAASGATTNETLGWVPQFLLTKGNITADWGIRDTGRDFDTTGGLVSAPNTNAVEPARSTVYKQTADGFSITPATTQTVYYLAIKA